MCCMHVYSVCVICVSVSVCCRCMYSACIICVCVCSVSVRGVFLFVVCVCVVCVCGVRNCVYTTQGGQKKAMGFYLSLSTLPT